MSAISVFAAPPKVTTATTALTPGNTPPAQISTQGEFTSPRGCRGTFGSVGTAQATRIDADFTGTDCQQATFLGQLVLMKKLTEVHDGDRSRGAARFLRTAFRPDDWVAVLLKSHDTGGSAPRVGPMSLIANPQFQAWLRAENARNWWATRI